MNTHVECIPASSEPESRSCPYCGATFAPKRPWQRFCSAAHRTAFDKEYGAVGKVAAVRRLRRGVSVTIHLEGPAAERALNLQIGGAARIAREPESPAAE